VPSFYRRIGQRLKEQKPFSWKEVPERANKKAEK
jgi:hypothetical protein